jgi:PAT family beta-lactamase induction signal transducer AmpG
MQLCWKQVAATQFTLYMAILNFGMSTGSYLMGRMEQIMEWKNIFLVNILFISVMVVVIYFMNFEKHTKAMTGKMSIDNNS